MQYKQSDTVMGSRAPRMRWAALLFCMFTTAIAENSYLFIAPKTVRPGHDLKIQGSLLAAPPSPVEIRVSLEKGEPERFGGFEPFPPMPIPLVPEPEPVIAGDQLPPNATTTTTTTTTTPAPTTTTPPKPEPFSVAYATLGDTIAQLIELKVPADLPEGDYDLRITGSGGLAFDNTTRLTYESKSHSIFIQTDKAIYKPGQTVHFRVLGVTPDLKVINDNLAVDVFDPSGNKINQWAASLTEMQTAGGVFERNMLMSDSPVLGDWKIKVTLGREKEEKTFTVDEYVLPKFEVSLQLPSFGRTTDLEFEGKVEAKYTFGKPVKGVADLRIRPKWPRFNWINGTRIRIGKDIELKFPIDGTATFSVSMRQLKEMQEYLDRSYLIFEANVTEALTGAKMSAESELQFFDKPIKIEFPESLPNTFKPGMQYTAVVKVSEQDDSPPTILNGMITIHVSHYKPEVTTTTTSTTTTTPPPETVIIDGKEVVLERVVPDIIHPGRWWWPRDEEIKQEPVSLAISPDGIVELPLTFPSDITRVEIRAEIKDMDMAYKSLQKSHSPSGSYLQLRLLTEKPKAGQQAEIELRSTAAEGQATYQVISKGTIVLTGNVNLNEPILRIPISANMAPKAKIVMYYVRPDGEIVADGFSFNIDGIFQNQVSIAFDREQASPAQKISLTVKADANSRVNILAVDKSVLLLKSGNDISADQVKSELQSYDGSGGFSSCDWFCWRWPMPMGGNDVADVFRNTGVVYITDALVYEYMEPNRPMPMFRSMAMGGAVFASPPVMMMKNSESAPAPDMLKPAGRVRKLFPETWLWKSLESSASGEVTIQDTVPDTITSWVATAFAIHPESGFGLSESAANLETFMKFFVTLHIPYSVTRGEKVIVQANVFNYSPYPLFAYVMLKRNPDYDNIHITSWWTSTYSADVARFVRVEPDSATAVYFPIIPNRIGKVDLHVQAQSLVAGDAIKKQLLVQPEGTPKEYNVPVLIDLKEQTGFTSTVPIVYPPGTVQGSERVRVTVIGDLMGPSINGLDELLKMPYGCGEQNMLNFAPNIFITKYLEITNNIDDVIFQKAKGYMVKGYQRELTYQHTDGSFSAFGNSDPSGSMWLSAFVLKSFASATSFIFVDDKVMHKTVDWILKNQNSNGTFNEPGKVLHKEMQGGSTAGERALTAYVLVALLEARVIEGVNAKISDAVQLSIGFLEGEVGQMTDVYELAITSYVLTLAGSAQAPAVLAKLQSLATLEDGMKYWTKAVATPAETNPWDRRKGKGKALNIELTAYALLTLAAANNRNEGLTVMKWLISQRNPNGGFSSTQDTIVALQALAEMASLVYSKDFDMTITVTGPPGSQVSESFTVNPGNALVLQNRELPFNIGEVTISASGAGLSLVEVAAFYHVDTDGDEPSFNVKVTLPQESINDFQVEVCTSWLPEGTSAMAIIEIGSPSGFAADKESVSPHPMLKRVEEGDKKVILYLDEIGKEEMCLSVSMQRTGLVAGAQPVPVRVYDYYEPTNQVTVFYVPEALRNSDVCDVCGEECEFCQQNRKPFWRRGG